MHRLVVVAKLKPGMAARAAELVADGPPFDPEEAGFRRHSVYVSDYDVVFLFEGPDVQWTVEQIVDDPVLSAGFSAWGPLIEGSPKLAREAYHWEPGGAPSVLVE